MGEGRESEKCDLCGRVETQAKEEADEEDLMRRVDGRDPGRAAPAREGPPLRESREHVLLSPGKTQGIPRKFKSI